MIEISPSSTTTVSMLTHNHRHNHSPSHSHMASPSCSPPSFSFPFFLIIITLFFFFFSSFPCFAVADEPLPSPPNNLDATTRPPPSITTLYDIGKPSSSGFKPGVAIVVGVLTLVFSLTFILLLYMKHCSGGGGGNTTAAAGISPSSRSIPSFNGRKNSGIDRSVVESLPIFRFGSLTGQKEGLDCAVCLTRFESAEVLRLLPKCKHAFHVECVDTWLDAHSTCPLCRYRVDPEDILLVLESRQNNQRRSKEEEEEQQRCSDLERGRTEIEESRRRHSSVGERESAREREKRKTTSFRRSLDSAKKSEGVGCFVRARKDGLLLTQDDEGGEKEREMTSVEQQQQQRRLEHRIIVSPSPRCSSGGGGGVQYQRWSDVQPPDLLYLTSEMILSESRRAVNNRTGGGNDSDVVGGRGSWNGRGIINSRSVSEITGLSRFYSSSNRNNNNNNRSSNGTVETRMGREEGLVSRWLAWISQSHHHPQPAVR